VQYCSLGTPEFTASWYCYHLGPFKCSPGPSAIWLFPWWTPSLDSHSWQMGLRSVWETKFGSQLGSNFAYTRFLQPWWENNWGGRFVSTWIHKPWLYVHSLDKWWHQCMTFPTRFQHPPPPSSWKVTVHPIWVVSFEISGMGVIWWGNQQGCHEWGCMCNGCLQLQPIQNVVMFNVNMFCLSMEYWSQARILDPTLSQWMRMNGLEHDWRIWGVITTTWLPSCHGS